MLEERTFDTNFIFRSLQVIHSILLSVKIMLENQYYYVRFKEFDRKQS